MLHWVESQSVLVTTLVVFGFCYVLAIATFGAATIVSRRGVARELKGASPATLTPLAVIFALLLAFLASRVWTIVDRAGEHVGQEASALRQAVLLADALPPDVRQNVREGIKRHLHFIETQDWPAMGRSQATLQAIAVGLTDAMAAVLSFTPAQPTQQLAQERTIIAIEHAFEARRNRILLSQLQIAPIQWAVIVVLTILILVTIAMLHIDNRPAMTTTLFVFSTAVAVCLVLLIVYDRPFAVGGVTLAPATFREIALD
jgi:FtsH-binding integral membrane protein